jgi:5-methylcytosine-specific restriction endonuclease McrA
MSVDYRLTLVQNENRPTVGSGRATGMEITQRQSGAQAGRVASPILHNAPGWSTGVVPMSQNDNAIAARDAAAGLIADLDSIEQRRRLIKQERSDVLETAQARFSAARSLDNVAATALFSELYWALPDVGAQILAGLFGRMYHGGQRELKPSPVGTGVHCVTCGSELMAESRTALAKIQGEARRAADAGYRGISCAECEKSRRTAFDAAWMERHKKEVERWRNLRSMPYSLYLKTPEWQTTRAAALKRARYACQLCKNTNTILDVHHNTYDRRGSEWPSDLLVVCRDCHGKHHDKLPAEATS